MLDPVPSGTPSATLDFLRERLALGNDCLRSGNARGAIVYYDSALVSFSATREAPDLREAYRALWNNKALAHQGLREFVPAQEAMMIANSLAGD